MDCLKNVIKFYINSSIHVALSVYCFLKITELYFDFSCSEALSYFVFYGTIVAYNFIKYAEIAKFHHRSLTKNLRLIQLFSFACLVPFCYYFTHLKIKTIVFIIPFALITLLYAVPFLGGFQKNLRSISYLKILIVSLVWSAITVLLPVYDFGVERVNSITLFLMILQRFLFVFVLILPFDIRDMNFDIISLQTIPKKIGIKKTKKVGFLVLAKCLVLEFLISENLGFSKVFLVVFFLTLSLLMRASEDQSPFYSSLGVEAIPIIWWGLLIIL